MRTIFKKYFLFENKYEEDIGFTYNIFFLKLLLEKKN